MGLVVGGDGEGVFCERGGVDPWRYGLVQGVSEVL